MNTNNSLRIFEYNSAESFDKALYLKQIVQDGIFLARFKEDVDFLELIKKIGTPHCHNGNGVYVWNIKPQAGETSKTVARSQTMEEFVFHTDCSFEIPPPKFVALYVIHEDSHGGGVSQMIDFESIALKLKKESIETLKRDFKVKIPKEFMKDREYSVGPILLAENRLSYRRDCIMDAELTPEQISALDDLDACINQGFVQSISLPKGAVLFLDNTRFLHARTEIRDPARHLQRLRYD